MANTVKQVEYYYTLVANQPGEGARVLNAFKTAGVNLLAYTGFPASATRAQLDLVPSDKDAFLAAARNAGIRLVGPKVAFLLQGDDRVGAVADVLAKLADARINVVAMNAVAAGEGRYGAILWVKSRKVRRAASLLGAS